MHLIAATLLQVAIAAPQAPLERPEWLVTAATRYQAVNAGRSDWSDVSLAVMRDFGRQAVGVELINVSRFDRSDQTGIIDSYSGLWRGSYANLRLQYTSSAEILPRFGMAAEVFQSVPGGYEVSASYRLFEFALVDDVSLFGVAGAKYSGLWYARAELIVVPAQGEVGFAVSGTLRRFLGEGPHELAEVMAGWGREVVLIGAGPVVQVRTSKFVAARVQRFVSRRAGFTIGLNLNDDIGVQRRSGIRIGVLLRW